jgi:hypothetical protein
VAGGAYSRSMGAKGFLLRLIRAIRILARDERIPQPLRWVAGIALLPIPGPVDEILLILIAPVFLLYREALREAWSRAAGPPAQADPPP